MKFLEISKKVHLQKQNIYIAFLKKKKKRKALFRLIKNYFCYSLDFQTCFHNPDRLLYYPQMSVFSFHTFSVLLYQILKNGT